MNKVKVDELQKLYHQIKEFANGERFGANHYDYPPNINRFELLVGQFYAIASNMEWPIKVMGDILDGQHSMNRQFMYLRSGQCTNKFETMKNIFSEIEQIMNEI